MYVGYYEKACMGTSLIITFSSTYLLIVTKNLWLSFIVLAGFVSFLTRLLRVRKQEYIMDHPLVKLDIICAIMAMVSYIYKPFNTEIYWTTLYAFGLMIVAAMMSWPKIWVEESFPLQFSGHLIIACNLLFVTFYQ